MWNTGRYSGKNTFIPSTKLPQFHFLFAFSKHGSSELPHPTLPWPCASAGTSQLNSHWPPLCLHTHGNGSGWLEASVMFFVIRIIFNNSGSSFWVHKNILTLRIHFGNFNEALQFTVNVYQYTKYKKSHIHINFALLFYKPTRVNNTSYIYLFTQQNGTFSSFIHQSNISTIYGPTLFCSC